jgi:NAD(P)-dependent dehydrogenase (short-subunit alcohol dehydrogenase family)
MEQTTTQLSTLLLTHAIFSAITPSIIKKNYPQAALLLLLWSLYRKNKLYLNKQIFHQTRTVAITGCDSGFGFQLVTQLVDVNLTTYRILAGCLTQQGIDTLQKAIGHHPNNNVTYTLLDVTSNPSMEQFQQKIEFLFPSGLDVIVANAGIIGDWLFDFTTIADYQRVMDVNYFGVIRTIKSALPSLKKKTNCSPTTITTSSVNGDEARIIIVASMLARISLIGSSGYSASKHACAALADSLRREMKPFNITVTTIEPGFMKTQIVTEAHKVHHRLFMQAPIAMRDQYGGQAFMNGAAKSIHGIVKISQDPSITVNAMLCAVANVEIPPPRITTGFDANYVFGIISLLPLHLQDIVLDFMMGRNKQQQRQQNVAKM